MAETAAGLRRTDMAGYILTGGKSRRMHGQDKLFLDYQGEAFCDHIRRALGSFPVVYLSAAPDGQKRYASLGLPVVADVLPGLGPMGGIYSGLLSCREPWLFVAACDMPLIRRETVDRVTDAYLEEGDGGPGHGGPVRRPGAPSLWDLSQDRSPPYGRDDPGGELPHEGLHRPVRGQGPLPGEGQPGWG